MADRLLRHTPSGVLYVYQDAFAMRPDFEEIIDVESREVPEAELQLRASRKARTKPSVVTVDDEAISADASRGLP